MTDLNYLLARHQLSTYASHNAACPDSRATHGAFARAYAARIEAARNDLGATSPMTIEADG
jgi:hypothetical protein